MSVDDLDLGFGVDGKARIAFSEKANKELRLAVEASPAWSFETIDALGRLMNPVALVFDGAGELAIAYSTGVETRVARETGGTFVVETVSSDEAVGIDVVIDDSGSLAVVHTNPWSGGNGDVFFSTRDGAGWTTRRIGTGTWERGTAVIQADGSPMVAFQGFDDDLIVATEGGSAILHRSTLTNLTADWRTRALPVTEANDDDTPTFPAVLTIPGPPITDDPGALAPLVLYRLLWDERTPIDNRLRLTRQGALVQLEY